jgi:SAM-dependent methyltransferase
MRRPLPRYNIGMDLSRRLVTLAPAEPEPEPESPDRGTQEELQLLTKRLAEDPSSWSAADFTTMARRFDGLAATWATRDNSSYRYPLDDALARGEVAAGGLCIEIGSGTGIQTPTLLAHFDAVVCIEVAEQMLRMTQAGRGLPLLADASQLPFRDGCAAAIVCVNAPLFAPEYGRVLAPDGVVVFVSTRGAQTPIYLPPDDVLAALQSLADPLFAGVTARGGPGTWTVARRTPERADDNGASQRGR